MQVYGGVEQCTVHQSIQKTIKNSNNGCTVIYSINWLEDDIVSAVTDSSIFINEATQYICDL